MELLSWHPVIIVKSLQIIWRSGSCLNIKILSCHYRDSHHQDYKDKMVSWPSYLYCGNPHTWKDCLYIETGSRYFQVNLWVLDLLWMSCSGWTLNIGYQDSSSSNDRQDDMLHWHPLYMKLHSKQKNHWLAIISQLLHQLKPWYIN